MRTTESETMGHNDNRVRALAEVVSIDAWHDDFDTSRSGAVDLHAQVSFSDARIGGEANSQIQFRLRLKRADLVVFAGREPIKIIRSTVMRDIPPPLGKATRTQEASTTDTLGAGLTVRSSRPSGKVAAGRKKMTREKLVVRSTIQTEGFQIQHMPTSDGDDRWIIRPRSSDNGLVGAAINSRLFEMKDGRRDRAKGLSPTINLEIHCAREDLDISDIEIKDAGISEKLMNALGSAHRLKAAEAYIRTQLSNLHLHTGDISGAFTKLILAHAKPSVEK